MYAEIAILNNSTFKTFTYHVPDSIAIEPGQIAQVQFRTALDFGVVLRLTDEAPGFDTKPIQGALHPEPLLDDKQLALAAWLAETYLSSLASALTMLLPPGLTRGARDIRITLTDPRAAAATMFEHRIISLLQRRGPLRGAQISVALGDEKKSAWLPAVHALEARDVVRVDDVFVSPRMRTPQVRTAMLAIHPDEIKRHGPALGKHNRRADVLEAVAAYGGLLVSEAVSQLGTTKNLLQKMADADLLTIDDDTVSVAVEDVDAALIELRKAEPHIRALRVLARENEPIDVSWVYAQSRAKIDDLKRLQDYGLILLGDRPAWRDSLSDKDFVPTEPLPLTPDQQTALDAITAALDGTEGRTFLLHGVTGSGKTEVYLQAIDAAVRGGRSVLILVPEIALTPQTTRRVTARFPGLVAVLHSGLSTGERFDTWRRAKSGLVPIIVGARSAIFAPLPNLGLIVLDEEHDQSYKQSPDVNRPPFRSAPHYHTRAVAEKLAELHGAVVVLGSATPSIDTAYRAHRGDITYLRLEERILAHRREYEQQSLRVNLRPQAGSATTLTQDLPAVKVVDMRAELRNGNRSMFSAALQSALHTVLDRREQAILFLNRRGQATYVFCRDCGFVARCPNCDMPLTHHTDGRLRCHHCGHEQIGLQQCPSCGSHRIRHFGAGTQQVEDALKKHFPHARTLRWDADTASAPASHALHLQAFLTHQVDVLVGTQMIAKGLDIPRVTLVGIVSADTSLALPDFRAAERGFQLLTQVAGRAGRGPLGGEVILQTYHPDHYAVDAASRHDYRTFYERELAYRRELGYPPLRRMVRVLFRYPTEQQARFEAERAEARIAAEIKKHRLTGTEIVGPAPAFFTRIDNFYRWHLLVRGPNPTLALRDVTFDKGWYVDPDPLDIL